MALRKLFTRFRELDLKLEPRKCHFFKEQVEFPGKLVNGYDVSISPDILETVEE